jgi:hypothetical protein
VYRLLVGKPERIRPLRRPRGRWADNIKMDLVERGLGDVIWVGLTQDRDRWRTLVNVVINLRFPRHVGKLPSGCTTCSLSIGAQLHRVS